MARKRPPENLPEEKPIVWVDPVKMPKLQFLDRSRWGKWELDDEARKKAFDAREQDKMRLVRW